MKNITAVGRPFPASLSGGHVSDAPLNASTEHQLRLHYLRNRLGLTKAQAGTLAAIVWGQCHD